MTYSVGYRGDMLRAHVGGGRRFGLRISWVDEGENLRGTGGALRLAMHEGVLEDAFFVLYGDSYLPVSMSQVEGAWRESKQPALMTVLRNEGRWDSSNAIYKEGRVTLYDKSRPQDKQSHMQWIDYGLSVLTRDLIATRIESNVVADLADLMKDLSIEGRLAGLEVNQRFYEAGSPSGVNDLENYLKSIHRSGEET